MVKRIYNDVLVLSNSGSDIYLGRASGSSEIGFTGRWINLSDKTQVVMDAEFFGGDFFVVDDLIVNNLLGATMKLMGR